MGGKGSLELDIAASPCLPLRQPTSRLRDAVCDYLWAFSFGHPEVESVIDSYLTPNSSLESNLSSGQQLVEAHRGANIRNLNMQLTQIVNQLEMEKRQTRQRQFWWEIPVNELGLQELQHLMFSLEELKNNVAKYATQLMLMDQTTLAPPISGTGPRPSGFGPYDAFDDKHADIYSNNPSLSFSYL
ncbi:hypothetical protein VNO80_08488 [Phaseolus coccineus]|uniref:Uncharacterized protein n=1 Tax=Phaseolus coccineus TaxID=3886 RepID=A0AAN9RBR2_PHACN